MPDTHAASGRVAVLVGLVVLAAVSLHGYLPGVERDTARRERDEYASSLVTVATLVAVSLGILLFTLIVHLRQRRTAPAPGLVFGEVGRRHRWRYLLSGLAGISAALVTIALLARVGTPMQPKGADLHPATPPGAATDPASPPAGSAHPAGWETPLFGLFVAATVVMMLVAATARLRGARGRPATDPLIPPDGDGTASAATGSGTLVRAAEVGLAEVTDGSRDPRAAIIACYAAMERELARVPDVVPQDFDTPTEVLARAVDHRALSERSAMHLVDLFEEARFSSHVMTEGHRETAVRVLQLVLAELRSVS